MLLDEPFAGIDPIAVSDIQQLVRHLTARGIGVLITDHNVRETLGICDRAYILAEGAVLAQGSPEAILDNADDALDYDKLLEIVERRLVARPLTVFHLQRVEPVRQVRGGPHRVPLPGLADQKDTGGVGTRDQALGLCGDVGQHILDLAWRRHRAGQLRHASRELVTGRFCHGYRIPHEGSFVHVRGFAHQYRGQCSRETGVDGRQ